MSNAAHLPPIQPYHPATFQERGVLIPFTTPLLAGTRARPAERSGLELVIPNPAGGAGVYVLNWIGISDLCQPTLHDSQLSEQIAAIPTVSPSTIRRVARQIADDGLAGEEAQQAAKAATDADKNDRTVSNFVLLLTLIDQVGLFRNATSGQPNMETRARLTMDEIAPLLTKSSEWVASALEGLGDVFATVGAPKQPAPSRVQRLVGLLRQTCSEMAAWSALQKQEDQAAYVRMTCAVAEYTLAIAEDCIAQAHALMSDLTALLRQWAQKPDSIVRLVSRVEWLLDGWEQICCIWCAAKDDARRRNALIEIALLVPVVPREARDWTNAMREIDPMMGLRRTIPLREDWRTGAIVFELTARNEHIRAMTC